MRGNGIKRLLAAPYRVHQIRAAGRQVLKTIQPDVVLGMGGFASGPGGVAAWLSGIPLLLHEQNAAAGLTNKLLARIARRVLMAFPGAFAPNARTAVVGNPVRPRWWRCRIPNCAAAAILCACLWSVAAWGPGPQRAGASCGCSCRLPIEVRHQCGKGTAGGRGCLHAGLGGEAEVSEFIKDMADAYAWADLVVCRAGADRLRSGRRRCGRHLRAPCPMRWTITRPATP